MPYEHYRQLLQKIKHIEAEKSLNLLKIFENHTLLNYPKLVGKHGDLFKTYIDAFHEVLTTEESEKRNQGKIEIAKLAALKARLGGLKNGAK